MLFIIDTWRLHRNTFTDRGALILRMARARRALTLLLVLASAVGSASGLGVSTRRAAAVWRRPVACRAGLARSSASESDKKVKANVNGALFGLAIAQQLSLCAAVAAARLGLWDPPPANLFTDIADRAMEEAIATGQINMYTGTTYAVGVWKDLLDMYYASGETTEFLIKAGGVCAEHAAWCAGLPL
jgi:hypothetical protein